MEVQLMQRVDAFLLQLGPILSQWHPCKRGPKFSQGQSAAAIIRALTTEVQISHGSDRIARAQFTPSRRSLLI